MLAVAGHLIQQNFRLPGMLSTSADLSFADMPNGLAALSKIPALGLFQIIAFIGFLELGVMKQKEGSFPGDMTLGGEPYAWTKFSDEVKEQKRVRKPVGVTSSGGWGGYSSIGDVHAAVTGQARFFAKAPPCTFGPNITQMYASGRVDVCVTSLIYRQSLGMSSPLYGRDTYFSHVRVCLY